MILVDFPTEKRYNIREKVPLTQSVQKGRILSHAKRNTKFTNFRRGRTPYTLWWDLSNSLVLQKTRIKQDSAKVCKVPPAQQPLHDLRFDSISRLRHNCWIGSYQCNPNIEIQQFIPGHCWIKKFPWLHYFTPISSEVKPKGAAPDYRCP